MRILITDDHALARRGIKEILEEEFPSAEFGEAQDGPQTLKLVAKERWHVVILDIAMPGMSGMEVLKNIKSTRPKLPVLMLSMYPEKQYGKRALKAKASGYLTKETAPKELVAAVKKVRAGGKYVSPSLVQELAFGVEDGHKGPPYEKLSDREYEVMVMLASGKAVSEISEELSLSVKTVSTYRSRILDKMKMKTNTDLTRYAMENKLVD